MFRRDFLKTTLGLLMGAVGVGAAKTAAPRTKIVRHSLRVGPDGRLADGLLIGQACGIHAYRGDLHEAVLQIREEYPRLFGPKAGYFRTIEIRPVTVPGSAWPDRVEWQVRYILRSPAAA